MKIEIEWSSARKLMLVVTAVNDTDHPEAVVGTMIDDLERGFGPRFEVEPALSFQGRMAKRLPYKEDALVWLAPGERLVGRPARLREFYAIDDSTARVRYRQQHPVAGIGEPWVELTSEWLELPRR